MNKKILLISPVLAISLQANSQTLPKIEITKYITTATKTKQSLKDVTSSVDIITKEDIKKYGFQTLSQAISFISGINYSSNGGFGQTNSIYLRGFATQKILVLIDGIRYNDPSSINGAPIEHILLDNVAKIEIIKGANSSIWGSDASGGVINIITKKATLGAHSSLSIEAGSFNSKKVSGSFSLKDRYFDMNSYITYFKTNGFSAYLPYKDDLDNYEDDGYKNISGGLNLGINITQNDRVEASIKAIKTDTEYDGFGADDINKTTKSINLFYSLAYLKKLNTTDIKIYANRSTFDRKYPQDYIKEYNSNNSEFGVQTNFTYKDDSFLVATLDHKIFKYKNLTSKSIKNSGISLTNSNKFDGLIGGTTIISESIRYDKYNEFKNKLTYKVGLKHSHKHIKNLSTFINYSTAYNTPTIDSLFNSFYGNTNLNPEDVTSFDVGFEYKNFKLIYFYNQVKNLISYDLSQNRYTNVTGKSKLKGVEVGYLRDIDLINTQIGLNYTYLDAKDKDHKQLLKRAKHSSNITLNYNGIKNLQIVLLGQYVGTRYDYGNIKLNSYFVLNTNINYHVWKNLNLSLKVDNILNRKYQTSNDYSTSPRAYYLGIDWRY